MANPASGIKKLIAYKVEATFGTAPGASGAQYLRNVTSSLDLTKDTYQSNEKRGDMQIADFRHGVRRVAGAINGELSPKTYADFFASAVRKDFAAVTAMTGLSVTIAGSGPTYTVARASGSFLTDGVKAGHVVRLSVGALNAANIAKNLLVVSLVAATLTVMPLNGVALVAEGPIATTTVTVTGKQTYVPATGHTDKSYSIEHVFSDITQSELFRGCKVSGIDVNLPPTGIATVAVNFMGQDITTATSAYFTTPTAITTTGVDAAVNGILLVGGTAVAIVTGLSIKLTTGLSGDPVVGSNVLPALYPGRVLVTGQITAYFADAVLRDLFVNETESSLVCALSCDNTAASDFITFVLPRIKVDGASKDDGEKGIVMTLPFQALYNSAGGTGISSEATTLLIQDSQA